MFCLVIQISLKKSVINMDIRLYNKVPVTIKKLSSYKSFKRELKYFLMNQVFYSIDEFLLLIR